MNHPRAQAIVSLPLKDMDLFRQQCHIDGAWVDADSGKRFAILNPATGGVEIGRAHV